MKLQTTRMHSSRMRTVRSSSHLSGEGLPQYTPPVADPPRPGTPGADPPDQAHPSPCGQKHTCKNITFATSLRTVNIPTVCLHFLHYVKGLWKTYRKTTRLILFFCLRRQSSAEIFSTLVSALSSDWEEQQVFLSVNDKIVDCMSIGSQSPCYV